MDLLASARRHALGWASAGALAGLMDALLAVARPGTEAFEPSVLASALALNVALHIAAGAGLGVLFGPVTVSGWGWASPPATSRSPASARCRSGWSA